MNLARTYIFKFFLGFSMVWLFIQPACTNRSGDKNAPSNQSQTAYKKPGSHYQDSLHIYSPAAVFYHPDSLQLLEIKAATDSSVYEGSTHEFFFLMRNARLVLKKNWPNLEIIEAKNYRYLVFHKKGGNPVSIDLDTQGDMYGLFVFDLQKGPLLIDMANIDTEVSFYLKK